MSPPFADGIDVSKVRYEVELFLTGGSFELFEDGLHLASVEERRALAEISYNKLILTCWGDGWARSWRVLTCQSAFGQILLQCSRQMGRTTCAVELRRGDAARQVEFTRKEHAKLLAGIIESNLSGVRVERVIAGRDDVHHLSGSHARLVLKERGAMIAGLGTSSLEGQPVIDSLVSGGLVWVETLCSGGSKVAKLMLFAPAGRARNLATRLTVLTPNVEAALFEVDEGAGLLMPVTGFDQGDLMDRLRGVGMSGRWPRDRALSPDVEEAVESIRRLAPDVIDADRRGGAVTLSIRGLPIARVSIASGRVLFGVGDLDRLLNERNRNEFDELVGSIVRMRCAEGPARDDFAFRAYPERWLESVLRRDITQLDPTLDPRHVYFQVPAYRGEQRSFIDLLAITRAGRLVVIELKVSEDIDFPFQGLDYWLRVEWHRRRNDFTRRGYFRGIEIEDAAPLVFLVAPLFRFHATTRLITRAISPDVPVYRIGTNEGWRSGVQVLLRERLN